MLTLTTSIVLKVVDVNMSRIGIEEIPIPRGRPGCFDMDQRSATRTSIPIRHQPSAPRGCPVREAETVGPGLQGLHAADGITLPLPPRHFQWLRFFSGISTPRHVSSVLKLTYVFAIPVSSGWESALPDREPP